MHQGWENTTQYLNVGIPQESLTGLQLSVDLAWGEEIAVLKPEVGVKAQMGELAAELIFVERGGRKAPASDQRASSRTVFPSARGTSPARPLPFSSLSWG
jgi:hypothetical protein